MLFYQSILTAIYDLPERKANILLVSATLTYGELKVSGSGRIYQDETGELCLQLISHEPPDPKQSSINFLMSLANRPSSTRRSTIADFAQLEATDDQGNSVSCDHIDLSAGFETAIYEGTFHSRIKVVSPDSEVFVADRATVVIKNRYNFATNTYDVQPNVDRGHLDYSSEWRHTWTIETNGLKLVFHKDLRNLQLDISGEELNEEIVSRIVYSLDFVMGVEHDEYYKIFFKENSNRFKALINKNALSIVAKTVFTAPYRQTGNQGDEEKYNTILFQTYYNYLTAHPGTLLTKWHKRIVEAGSGYYYRYGLVLTIGIEKILQKLYPLINATEAPYDNAEMKQAKLFTDGLTDERLRSKLSGFLDRLQVSNAYLPNKMLAQLEQSKVISQGATASWQKLRNSYAHGADYNDNLPKAMDLATQNITLYYELIFNRIAYQGKYTNFFKDRNGAISDYPLIDQTNK